MTDYPELRRALRRVQGEASAACASYHTWWELQRALGDADLNRTINNYHYVDFFRVATVSSFRVSIVSLGAIYDTKRGPICFKYLIKHSKLADVDKGNLQKVCHDYRHTIKGVREIRSRTIAHNDPKSVENVFRAAGISHNQIKELIDATREVVNNIATQPEFGFNPISDGSRNVRAVANLLGFLQNNSFLDE